MHDPKHVTPELLAEVNAAFARHDPAAIAAHFAPDGVFVNAKGAAVEGDEYRGPDAIRAFFVELFRTTPVVQWEKREAPWFAGDRVVTQWRRKAVTAGGERQEWLGCDLYTFRDRKIVRKDTYVKIVVAG